MVASYVQPHGRADVWTTWGAVTRVALANGHGPAVDVERVARARARMISAEDASRLAGTLSLLADPTRACILYALDTVDELCVGDLALAVGVSEDAVSYALRLLRTAGLVVNRREGRVVFYRLAPDFPVPLREHCLRHLVEMSRSDRAGDPEIDAPLDASGGSW